MHLSSESALDLIDGRLPKDEEVFWNQHVKTCEACSNQVRQWREMRVALRRSHLKSAPEADVHAAIGIFRPRPEASRSGLRRILAAVRFDSFFEPALAGARGSASASRQVVLQAEDFDIHLKIWGEPGHKQVLGQLLSRSGEPCTDARFRLLSHSEELDTTTADETGEFSFADIPEGEWSLQADLPNLTIIGTLKSVS